MFGLMLKKTHDKLIGEYTSKLIRIKNEDNIKRVKLEFLTKRKDELFTLNAGKMLQIEKLQARLYNAVEGFSPDEVKILRARQEGNYIYRVTGDSDSDGLACDIIVPKLSTNFDGYAKSEAIKKLGLPWKSYKNLTAKRLTL